MGILYLTEMVQYFSCSSSFDRVQINPRTSGSCQIDTPIGFSDLKFEAIKMKLSVPDVQ